MSIQPSTYKAGALPIKLFQLSFLKIFKALIIRIYHLIKALRRTWDLNPRAELTT